LLCLFLIADTQRSAFKHSTMVKLLYYYSCSVEARVLESTSLNWHENYVRDIQEVHIKIWSNNCNFSHTHAPRKISCRFRFLKFRNIPRVKRDERSRYCQTRLVSTGEGYWQVRCPNTSLRPFKAGSNQDESWWELTSWGLHALDK
jgi:hypothetical protein